MYNNSNEWILPNKTIEYVIKFLVDDEAWKYIYYGFEADAPEDYKIIIIPSNEGNDLNWLSDGELITLDNEDKTPLLFGTPEIQVKDNKTIIYADLIKSSAFLLSRREEVIKKYKRDEYGRFLAKDSFLCQNKWILRPIVDEYGEYLKKIVCKTIGKKIENKQGFRKIWLTHDIDEPYYYRNGIVLLKQIIKNLLPGYSHVTPTFSAYFNYNKDPFYTFPQLMKYDDECIKTMNSTEVEVVYFLICAKSTLQNRYCDINSLKFKKLISDLQSNGVSFGIHLSHEAGQMPDKIIDEVQSFPMCNKNDKLYSRHHFLRWCEPQHYKQMIQAGITDDFTISFADCVGFRVGTCRPYEFIDPVTGELSGLIIHPLEIMECSLDRKQYMGLEYKDALNVCKKIILKTYKYNGELNILFHNSSLASNEFNYDRLYSDIMQYLKTFY